MKSEKRHDRRGSVHKQKPQRMGEETTAAAMAQCEADGAGGQQHGNGRTGRLHALGVHSIRNQRMHAAHTVARYRLAFAHGTGLGWEGLGSGALV